MSRASEIILLCEDRLQEVAVRRFLRKRGANHRQIRVPPYPKGRGCGEQYVRGEYANELKGFRQRSSKAQTLLIAVIDADTGSVEERCRQLEEACEGKGIEPRGENEAVVHFVPRRHIETWLAYLDGQLVNETDSYKGSYAFSGRESDAKQLVDRLCHGDLPGDKPPSLRQACEEWRVRGQRVMR